MKASHRRRKGPRAKRREATARLIARCCLQAPRDGPENRALSAAVWVWPAWWPALEPGCGLPAADSPLDEVAPDWM